MVKKSMATSIAVDTTLVILLSVALLPGVLWAQQASGIAGVVRDATGAVLPGVTVEAASPALIEKVRTSVTDGEGQYKIIDLRPGTYAITFGLPGFSSVKREGIELSAGFTATVNAEMRVGTVEETVTVSGSSPLVDVQNARQQTVLSDELLDALPSGSKSMAMLFNLTPGFSGMADVGGSRGVYQSSFINASFRGKTNLNKTTFDGMRTNVLEGTSQSGYFPASAAVEEITLETGGGSAESSAAGAVVNFIPKEGGNSFSGGVWGLFSDDRSRSLRSGSVDGQTADAEPGHASRLSQYVCTRTACPRGTVGARARLRSGPRSAGMDRLESAARRGVRPVRQRPDGSQGVPRPVSGSAGGDHRRRQ
jgi:hypothetical protein